MPGEIIAPETVHRTAGYSHAIKAGNTVYIAGQVAQDADGNLVGEGDIEAQVAQVWRNLTAVLAAAGGTLDDITKITVFTTDLAHRPAIAAARQQVFTSGRYPASTFLVVQSLATPQLLVEIEAIAVVGS